MFQPPAATMEPTDDSNGLCQPKGLFIRDRKQDPVQLRFNNLYYTVSLGLGKGECLTSRRRCSRFATADTTNVDCHVRSLRTRLRDLPDRSFVGYSFEHAHACTCRETNSTSLLENLPRQVAGTSFNSSEKNNVLIIIFMYM